MSREKKTRRYVELYIKKKGRKPFFFLLHPLSVRLVIERKGDDAQKKKEQSPSCFACPVYNLWPANACTMGFGDFTCTTVHEAECAKYNALSKDNSVCKVILCNVVAVFFFLLLLMLICLELV